MAAEVAYQSQVAIGDVILQVPGIAVGLLGQSVVTALLAMPLLGQFLSVFQIIGGLLVLSGIFLVNMKRRQRKSEAGVDGTSG